MALAASSGTFEVLTLALMHVSDGRGVNFQASPLTCMVMLHLMLQIHPPLPHSQTSKLQGCSLTLDAATDARCGQSLKEAGECFS